MDKRKLPTAGMPAPEDIHYFGGQLVQFFAGVHSLDKIRRAADDGHIKFKVDSSGRRLYQLLSAMDWAKNLDRDKARAAKERAEAARAKRAQS